jgi:hypothetical protein
LEEIKMSKIVKVVLAAILAMLFVYCIWAFVLLGFNIALWEEGQRAACAWFMFCAGGVVAFFSAAAVPP